MLKRRLLIEEGLLFEFLIKLRLMVKIDLHLRGQATDEKGLPLILVEEVEVKNTLD